MSRQADLALWAEQSIRNKTTGKSESSIRSLAARQLVSELQANDFWIAEDSLCALEVVAGDKPLSYQPYITARCQEAIDALDEVVKTSCQIVNGQLTRFDLQRVAEIHKTCPVKKVTSYGQLIHSVDKRMQAVHVDENNIELASSLLRIAATRPVLRAVRRAQEKQRLRSIGFTANQSQLKQARKQFKDLVPVTTPFLSQLQFNRDSETLALPTPVPSVRKATEPTWDHSDNKTSSTNNYGWIVIAVLIVLSALGKFATRSSSARRSHPNLYSPSNVSPLDSDKTYDGDELRKLFERAGEMNKKQSEMEKRIEEIKKRQAELERNPIIENPLPDPIQHQIPTTGRAPNLPRPGLPRSRPRMPTPPNPFRGGAPNPNFPGVNQ